MTIPWLGVTLLQVTLLGVLGALVWLVLRRASPALRGGVVLATLLGVLVVPALGLITPVWLHLPSFERIEEVATLRPQPARTPTDLRRLPAPPPAVAPTSVPVKPMPGLEGLLEPFEEAPLVAERATLMVEDGLLPEEFLAERRPLREEVPLTRTLIYLFVTLWFLGAALFLACALTRLAILYVVAGRAKPIDDAATQSQLHAMTRGQGLATVQLRESPLIRSPLTMGLLRPVILLPVDRGAWTEEQHTLVLAHELAHVRRHDFLAGLAAELAVCLFWFHPLVRWLASRLRLEQEYAADAWAASATSDALNYVRCLARLALELRQGSGSLAPAFWRRRPEILRRIDMLRSNPHGQAAFLGRGSAGILLALAAAACLIVAGIGPLPSIAEEPKPADAAPEVRPAATTDAYGDPLPAGALARLGTTRWRHGAAINFVGYGPEGKTLITAGQDNTVRLWDLDTGKEIRRFARPQVASTDQPAVQSVRRALAAVPVVPPAPPKPDAAKPTPEKASPVVPPAQDDSDAAKLAAEKARAEAAAAAKLAAEKARAEAERLAALQQLARAQGGATNSNAVALTVDGKTLAVSGANIIQLYDVATGSAQRKLTAPPMGISSLVFSPDGLTLAGRMGDGGIVLWDPTTGSELRQIKVAQAPGTRQTVAFARGGGESTGLAFSADGKTIAAATTEYKEQTFTGVLKLWDVATGDVVRDIKAVEGVNVSGVAFSPDGKVLAYCTNQVVHLSDPATGKEIRQFDAPELMAGLLFSPDSKALAIRGRTGLVRLFEVETGKLAHQLGEAEQTRGGGIVLAVARQPAAPETRPLAFSADGKRLATTSSGTIRLWDPSTGKELPLADGHQSAPSGITLTTDGKTVVSWGADRVVRRWDAASGKQLGTFRVPPEAVSTLLTPDGRGVALALTDGTIRLHDAASGKELLQVKGPAGGAGGLAFTPDGRVLAARGADGVIRLYDLAKGAELRQMAAQPNANSGGPNVVAVDALRRGLPGGRSGLVFSPDGKLLAASSGATGPVYRVTATGAAATQVAPPARAGSAGISLFDVATGKLLRKIESSQPVASFAFSPDGRVLAGENADLSISLFEVASGKERGRLGAAPVVEAPRPPVAAGGGGPVTTRIPGQLTEPATSISLAFTPDGRTLVSRGPNNAVRVWDVTTGKELGQFKGHDGRVETISVAANGQTFASGSVDTTILLWNAADVLKELQPLAKVELQADEVGPLWESLIADDATKASQSVLKLVCAPQPAAAFLGEHLQPAAAVDPKNLERWLADLESDKFAIRQEAAASLLRTGEQAVPALQKLLASQPTIETRKRSEELLDKLTTGTLTPEQLRLVRAIEALERMKTPEARAVLEKLTRGASGALSTREAQAAVTRLSRS